MTSTIFLQRRKILYKKIINLYISTQLQMIHLCTEYEEDEEEKEHSCLFHIWSTSTKRERIHKVMVLKWHASYTSIFSLYLLSRNTLIMDTREEMLYHVLPSHQYNITNAWAEKHTQTHDLMHRNNVDCLLKVYTLNTWRSKHVPRAKLRFRRGLGRTWKQELMIVSISTKTTSQCFVL